MSKEELFIMHVYMCVCLYIDIILLIYYLCCRSLFKTLLYLFLWKYSSRKTTNLSLHLVPFSDSSGPLLWSHGGLQCNALASAMHGLGAGGPDSFSWFQLLVPLRPAVWHQISCFTPDACSSPPLQWWQWREALGHTWDAVHSPTEALRAPHGAPLHAAPVPHCPEESLHHSLVSWDLRFEHPASNASLLR